MKNPQRNSAFLGISSLILVLIAIFSIYNPIFVFGFPLAGIMTSVYLWHNASHITGLDEPSRKVETYRSMTFLSVFVFILFFLSYLVAIIPKYEEIASDIRYFVIVFFVFMFGNNAPKIPYNRALGLRISWTLKDESTWKYAHLMVGYCSIPCVLWMMLAYAMNNKMAGYLGFITTMTIIPSILSYFFYRKRAYAEEKRFMMIWIFPIFILLILFLTYPYLPDAFPMQFASSGEVNYYAPKLYASLILIGVDILLLFCYHSSTTRKQIVIQVMFMIFFVILISYVLFQYGTLSFF